MYAYYNIVQVQADCQGSLLRDAMSTRRAAIAAPARAPRASGRRGRSARVAAAPAEDAAAMVRLTTALRRIDDAKSRDGGGAWRVCEATGARVRAPRAKTPWGCVHFVGGAVLGSFPDVAYDAWLSACADDVGLVVVATPYELDLDRCY